MFARGFLPFWSFLGWYIMAAWCFTHKLRTGSKRFLFLLGHTHTQIELAKEKLSFLGHVCMHACTHEHISNSNHFSEYLEYKDYKESLFSQ